MQPDSLPDPVRPAGCKAVGSAPSKACCAAPVRRGMAADAIAWTGFCIVAGLEQLALCGCGARLITHRPPATSQHSAARGSCECWLQSLFYSHKVGDRSIEGRQMAALRTQSPSAASLRAARGLKPAAQLRGRRAQRQAWVASGQLLLHAAPALQADTLQPAARGRVGERRWQVRARAGTAMPRPFHSRALQAAAKGGLRTGPRLGPPGKARWRPGACAHAHTPDGRWRHGVGRQRRSSGVYREAKLAQPLPTASTQRPMRPPCRCQSHQHHQGTH